VGGIRTPLALLMPTFALPAAPPALPGQLHRRRGRSPTMTSSVIRGFGHGLSPGGLSVPRHSRPVSYYALFQGWLLLSQPPGCLRAATALPTEPVVGDLSRRSGLFPSRRRIFAPAVSRPPPARSWPSHDPRRGLQRLVRVGKRQAPSPIQRPTATPPCDGAAPKCISGRTSYLRVRLAFHR
jgi:hypothetical protein